MGDAMNGHLGVLTLLLGHGAQVDVKNDFGETALLLAQMKGHEPLVTALSQRQYT